MFTERERLLVLPKYKCVKLSAHPDVCLKFSQLCLLPSVNESLGKVPIETIARKQPWRGRSLLTLVAMANNSIKILS